MSDDEDLEYEEFLSMSDEQTDAMLERMMKEHEDNLRKLNPRQLYRYRRCDGCEQNAAEAAYERFCSDFHDGGNTSFKTLQQQQIEAKRLK